VRRAGLVLAAILVGMVVASGVALAANQIKCPNRDGNRCVGTAGADNLEGTPRSDRISGAAGNDYIDGQGNPDELVGGRGNDRIWGGPGGDTVYGLAGDDTLVGWRGYDRIVGGDGADGLVDGEEMFGGDGNDRIGDAVWNQPQSGSFSAFGGGGDDVINAMDNHLEVQDGISTPDTVECGTGSDDRVKANPDDTVAEDCEHVEIVVQ
jgi:Ca2+-binding RTX toxin-like protein